MFKHWRQIGVASLCAVVLVGGFGLSMMSKGKVIDKAAARDYDPGAKQVFMDENLTPLAESLNADNTAAMQAQLQAALDATNRERAAAGVPALVWNDSLAQCATVRASEITSVWAHTRPNGNQWWTVNSQVQYGENLAKNYQTGESVVAGWMASPTHRENLLDSGFKTVGMAVYNLNGYWYWAQEFGY